MTTKKPIKSVMPLAVRMGEKVFEMIDMAREQIESLSKINGVESKDGRGCRVLIRMLNRGREAMIPGLLKEGKDAS